ncbi:MAG TPA: tetratricopeptide repeat protein [Flavisolibacter sp.]|jgi:tetratricopeptide (TPR) repeat protein|nr:tetratricopeptide repeat protein [Flavisolibacter sp.]
MKKYLLIAAAATISTSLFAQSDSASFYFQKGLDEKAKGHSLIAIQHFEKAYNFNKNDKQVVGELAADYLNLRRYTQARDKFLQLESMGDQSDSTFRQLMLLSYNLRNWDDAIKYALLLKKQNVNEKTAFYIGKSYYEKEDLGNAIKYFGFAAKEDPANAEVPYTIARAYADMQNHKEAIPYFLKAIELNPNNSRWVYETALIYYAIPDDQNALKYMLMAKDKGYREDNEFLQNLATAYSNAGKPEEAINLLKGILEKRPSDINVINMLAESYYDNKKYDEAIAYYDKLLQMNAKNAEAMYMMGMSFQKKGEKQKGQAICDKAIELDPSLQNLKKQQQMPGF